MKQYISLIFLSIMVIMISGCNTKEKSGTGSNKDSGAKKTDTLVMAKGTNPLGIGRFKNVQLTHPLDADMVMKGETIFNTKCMACHKLSSEKLVGPGWQGVTDRRQAEWILNFITNTQVMLDKDLVAQSEMVTCLIRMPNQDLTDEQARTVLEFMRKNDKKN